MSKFMKLICVLIFILIIEALLIYIGHKESTKVKDMINLVNYNCVNHVTYCNELIDPACVIL